MIQRTKKRYLHIATIIFLSGILVTATPSYADPGEMVPDNSASNASGVAADAPKDSLSGAETMDSADQTPEKSRFKEKAAKFLDAISKHPSGREAKIPDWKLAQEKAVLDARAGNYEQALPVLERLHSDHPQDLGIATDYAAILGWAGRDADAVAAYKALSEGTRPDYLIDSIGHAYRNLHQPDEALTVYRLGLQTYPDNQSFMAGEILSLLESGHNDEAVAKAQQVSNVIAQPVDSLGLAIRQTFHANAIDLARKGDYKNALPALAALHKKYPDDFGISTDIVAVLSWAGRDAEAVVQFHALPKGDVPDYVLDAAAHSYRNLHQSKDALALYQAALNKNPDNVTYAVGVVYSLSDLGRSGEALKVANAQLAKHPEKPAELVKAYTYVERRRAIDLARGGHYEQALKILRELRAKYPSDITEKMDYIAVSGWAAHDKDATTEYHKIVKEPMPDYVLEAVGHSHRNQQEAEKALEVYRRGLKQSPRNEIFAAGEIRCLDDLGRYGEAVARAKEFTSRYGDHLDVLLGGGEAANLNDEAIEALNFYERAGAIAPRNTEGLRGLITTENRVGAPHLALKTADMHPGLMKPNEYNAIVGSADSTLVRWGPLEPVTEATRYDHTDAALASLDKHIGEWNAKNDPSLAPNIMRARFDRLIALRDRSRMQDVVNNYNDLVQQGVEIPTFALEAVGEAYLYLREPEIARDVFLKVLQSDPDDYETRRLLAYAYLESNQYDEAYASIDEVEKKEPVWVYLKGEPERQANADDTVSDHAITGLDAGELRMYGELLDEADDRLTSIVHAGPFDPRNRAAAAELYLARGWPRKALEQNQIGLAIQDGHDVANESGIAMANLELQNFREADSEARNLMQRFPENLKVQRLNRDLDIYNMMELDAHAGYQFAPSENKSTANIPHGQGYDVGAELYSSPIDYNWRLFAGHDYAHEHNPNDEGIIDYNRSNLGAQYRNGDVTASVAPTMNLYNSHERVGVNGKGDYTFNDMWSAGIAAELFSSATPLRALNAGVTANMYDVNGKWRQSESRSVTFDAYAMPFSDGNFRTVQDAEYIQRLYTDPRFQLDMEGDLAASQNNKDENRLYYNPKMDLLASAGLRGTHTLYRRYETLYEHSLLVLPGLYAQQDHSVTPAWAIRYEQRVHYNDTLNAGVGVDYTHQRYDGLGSDAVSLMMDVVERF